MVRSLISMESMAGGDRVPHRLAAERDPPPAVAIDLHRKSRTRSARQLRQQSRGENVRVDIDRAGSQAGNLAGHLDCPCGDPAASCP